MTNPAPSQKKNVFATDAKTTAPGKAVEYLLITLAGYFNRRLYFWQRQTVCASKIV